MLVEIPDPEVILGVILAFLIGMGGLYGYFKIRPFIKSQSEGDATQAQRLEYYERQLIDMKIRLDALEMEGLEPKTVENEEDLRGFLEKLAKNHLSQDTTKPKKEPKEEPKHIDVQESVPNTDSNDITGQVLHLITTKPMTSRDIQTALKKSREHSSRFLKKLFEDGYIDRDTKSKPYTYFITKKGKEKIGLIENSPTVA